MTTDVEAVADKVLERLDQVAGWVQGTGTEVLALYTQKAMMAGIGYAVLALLIFAACGLFGVGTVRAWKAEKAGEEDSDDVPCLILAGITLVIAGFGGLTTYSALTHLMIPEYYAIQELLKQVM